MLAAVCVAARILFIYLYSEKTLESTIDFIKHMLEDFPFYIHCIQTCDGLENLLTKNFYLIDNICYIVL